MPEKAYTVRACHCDHGAADKQVYEALKRATEPLSRSWQRLQKARRIVLKFNMLQQPVERYAGRRRELVDDAVCGAVLRLLRERSSAELVATDTDIGADGHLTPEDFNYRYLLDKFGVSYVDSNLPPFATYEVPGGGCMFRRYMLNACLKEADEVVSVAKMKNHLYMGVTLCTKNLFGLPPMIRPEGRTRSYYHHLIRLSYVLPDLALITQPCLNIIDGLTGQSGREWGGQGRIANVLVAGDHPIATDTCGTYLMGHDPRADWPTPPFCRDRNHLLVATEHGFGTVDPEQIDFHSEATPPLAPFDVEKLDPPQTVENWRRTTCQQGLYYRENQGRFVNQYAGQFIYLQDNEVVWHGPDPENLESRRILSGRKKDSALWLKLVDPEECEGEHFEVYEHCLSPADKTNPASMRGSGRSLK